jgi:hypothetical protein
MLETKVRVLIRTWLPGQWARWVAGLAAPVLRQQRPPHHRGHPVVRGGWPPATSYLPAAATGGRGRIRES